MGTTLKLISGSIGAAALGGTLAGCVEEPPPPPPPPPSPALGCYPAPTTGQLYDIEIVGASGTLNGLRRFDPSWVTTTDCTGNSLVTQTTASYVYATDAGAAQTACDALDPATTTVQDLTPWGLATYYSCSYK